MRPLAFKLTEGQNGSRRHMGTVPNGQHPRHTLDPRARSRLSGIIQKIEGSRKKDTGAVQELGPR